MKHSFLQLSWVLGLMICGSLMRTKYHWMTSASMLANCSLAGNNGTTSTRTLENSCYTGLEAISRTLIGASAGTMTGTRMHTQVESYRLHAVPYSHHVRKHYTVGFGYIIQHGSDTSGQHWVNMPHTLTLTPWTNHCSGVIRRQDLHAMADMEFPVQVEAGGRDHMPSPSGLNIPSKPCIGKTGRRWQIKQPSNYAVRWGRRQRTRPHLPGSRPMLWMTMMIFPCPLHWLLQSRSMFHDRLIAASLQLFIRVTYAWAQWTMPSSETPSIFMSDSSVEERPPPDRPAGPPPPIPVQAQQDLAHHVSTVVADAIGFQGSILCYLPWDLRHLKCLVVSIRAMRPHERRHPNVLEIRDAPSAEEADRAEAGDAEGDHVDAPESATEASMEAGVESTHGIEASSSGHGGTEGHPESLVNHTIRRMEAEGRSVMTSAEIAAIQADFDAASEEENTVTFDHLFGEESHADGGTGDGDDASETHNATDTRAASSGSTPQAKPRALGQKKRGTHLFFPQIRQILPKYANPAHLIRVFTFAPGENEAHRLPEAVSRTTGQDCRTGLQYSMQSLWRCHFSWTCLFGQPQISSEHGKRLCSFYNAIPTIHVPFGGDNELALPLLMDRYSFQDFVTPWAGDLQWLWMQIWINSTWILQACAIVCRFLQKLISTSKAQPQSTTIIHDNTCVATTGRKYDSDCWAGPKSGRVHGGSASYLLLLCIMLTCIHTTRAVNTDVRVDVYPTMTSEATSAKPVGQREVQSNTLGSSIPRCVKRTYKRAYARSCREGGAWYRGQWRPHAWFTPTTVRTKSLGRMPQPKPTSRTLTTVTWNAGGLHAQVYRELETWMQDKAVEVMCIQETKWDFDGTWSTPFYHFIHSAGHNKEDKVGGVLTAISTKLAAHSDIQFHPVCPGRVLHVRINKGPPTDIINVYQYTANDHKLTPDRRHKLLQRFQSTLRSVPARNAIIMAGDFNTTCVPTEQVCGKWIMPASEAHNKDHTDLTSILIAHKLTVLNSWTRPRHHQLATFSFGTLSSQIDFIMCRQANANNKARQAAVIPQFPVAGWRDGAKHYPVLAQIPARHHQWHQPQTPAQPKLNISQIIQDVRQPCAPEALQHLRDRVHQGLQDGAWDDIQQLEEGIQRLAQEIYPAAPRPQASTEEALALSQSARNMWALFRTMRTHSFTVHGVVQAWKQWAKFQHAHREHKARSKQRSKSRKHDLLTQAQTAAEQGDMHQVWQVVKTLAPKSRRKPLQLYRNGHMMTPENELDWIVEAFGDRYGARPPQVQNNIRQQQPVRIEVADLWHQLESLNLRKAVPYDAAPSVLWKACSAEVSEFVVHHVNRQWAEQTIMVQQSWADATVALLPKPTGKNDTPLDWRPIGVQHPLGKCFMRLIINQAKHQIHQLVKEWPQSAYVPNRSTHTALKRVLHHCDEVRSKCMHYRTNLHQKKEGVPTTHQFGGLQISMDLSAAFDLVPWTAIKEALELAQVEPSIQEILMQWLGQVRYKFRHKGMEKELWPSWGLRQGCIGSPVLWAAFTALLNRAIDHRIQKGWCREHATMYADDSHFKWTFCNFQELERAIVELRWVIAIFRRLGMKVNTHKTKAIMSISGAMKHRIHKLYIRHQGADKHLLLSPGDPSTWIKLVDKTEYLGLIISYDNFEGQSVKHRTTKAHQRRWALASILHTRRMSIKYKLQLWRSCVLSTMMYALHCLCLGPGHVRTLQRAMMKHVRAIVSDQAFLTGVTHEEIMNRYGIPTVKNLLDKAHHRELQLDADEDWMIHTGWNEKISASLQNTMADEEPLSDADKDIWMCPICSAQFPSTAALKIHARKIHKVVNEPQHLFDKTKHSLHGLPQCSQCFRKFSKWQTLLNHINNDSCPAQVGKWQTVDVTDEAMNLANASTTNPAYSPDDRQPEGPPHHDSAQPGSDPGDQPLVVEKQSPQHVLVQQRHVQQTIRAGLNAFIHAHDITSQLQQYCSLCGQWIASQKVMKRHYQHSHSDLYQQFSKRTQRLIEQKATPSIPCHFCRRKTRDWKAHFQKCTVLWQCSFMCAMHEADGELRCRDGRILRSSEGRGDGKREPGPEQDFSIRTFFRAQQKAPKPVRGADPPPCAPSHTPQGLPGSPFVQPGQDSDQTAGRTPCVEARHGPDIILHAGTGHSAEPPVHHGLSLQGQAGRRAGMDVGSATHAHGVSHGLVQGVSGSAQQHNLVPGEAQESNGSGWRDSTGWRYQVWNRSTRQLEADPQRTPIPDDQLLDHLATVLQCLKHPILTRFACTRRMAETMTSQATFKMDVALRSHSALTFWDEMQVLRGNSVFQLVGMGYKTESLGRGPAEQKLLDMMYGRK